VPGSRAPTCPRTDLCAAALGHRKGRVDETFFFSQRTALAKLVGDVGQKLAQNLVATPGLEAPMHCSSDRTAALFDRPWDTLLMHHHSYRPKIEPVAGADMGVLALKLAYLELIANSNKQNGDGSAQFVP
jgi:hypothetical protein